MNKASPEDYRALRALAMGVIEGRGDLIEAARQVARGLNEAGIPCAVIGGIAVVLHGHPRTTRVIDLLVNPALDTNVALSGLGKMCGLAGFCAAVRAECFLRANVGL